MGGGGVGGDDERNVAGVVNTRVVLLFLFYILFLYIVYTFVIRLLLF
jgi:hypothetical protein